ncbi:MAG TPA: protein kinase [Polyangia bacterium]|jgi:serine/threonine protein kinase|nr:protein kinase [Polyangia bacterium]
MSDFPRRFGPYVLLKPLARGGMGALYLALSSTTENAKLCVIKTVLPHLADKEYLQRFRDEAKVVVRLSHGNLVPVFDSGQVGGEIYLAMDFVDGKDLRATWNRCAKKGIAFPIDVAAHIVKELTRGLHYAHTFGDIKLVHRDVSPPNVLLSYSGEVRLTDFGLASSTLKLEKTAPGIIYGKVSYMSPEQARGEKLDGRTDVYAAGIILWELLTGRQVFPAGKPPNADKDTPTAEELLRRVRNPEVVAPSRRASRVPPDLDRIAMKALSVDSTTRYQTCEELRYDLATFLAQTSPATDSVRVSKFLADLYGEDIESERLEREKLISDTQQISWPNTPSPPLAPVVKPPSTTAAKPPPLRLPGAAAQPLAPRDGEVALRREKGTLIAGPAAHDHRLDKRNNGQARSGRATSGDRTSQSVSTAPIGDTSRTTTGSMSGSDGPSTAVLGTVVGGRYLLRRLHGEGGMGRVYEAEHIDIGKRVALKILHPAYSQTPDLVERLRREARAASKISHPNVVDVTDSGTTADGAFFFAMEYIEGIELGELIFRETRLEVPRALLITAQVCRGLQAAHEVNVIHRDLKPENVLILARDGHKDFVKVLDFGIAKSAELDEDKSSPGNPSRRLTSPGMAMGTPEYMAPEQAAGRPADPRSDIYAVGGILYEMLTGHPPYEGSNFMEILHKKANQMPKALSAIRNDVPAELEALIMRTMAKDPAARPQTMEELEREILHLMSTLFPNFRSERRLSPVHTPHPVVFDRLVPAGSAGAVWTRLRNLERRERRKLAIGAGALFGLVLAVVVATTSGRKPMPHDTAPLPPVAAAVVPTPPPVVQVPVPEPTPPAPAEEPAAAASAPDVEPTATVKTKPALPAPMVDSRKLLDEGERFLRADRFVEARGIFTKLTKSRRDRGPALVGLAEISFQEKNYAEAVRWARQAAGSGGGVRARVLLGDAHFRLNQFKEASKAYEDALKLDPANASAKSGLALATKRM